VYNILLDFPTSHAQFLADFRKRLKAIPRISGQKIVVVMDGIVSNPGWVMPWEEMVKICKEEGAISLVDGAHCIGQQKLDLAKSDPDFFVTVSDRVFGVKH
jgi:selenocysteine lyase/cysteine desulfurase